MIENVRTCTVFCESLKIRGKKFERNLPENSSKSTKTAIAVYKFSKNYWESMPPDPLRAIFVPQIA